MIAKKVATCLGYGPRFLHSTGQAYKGGPNSGVFLQITCDNATDVPVPGRQYTFGVVKAAQARGDFEVLVERDRRALRVHLGSQRGGRSGHAATGDQSGTGVSVSTPSLRRRGSENLKGDEIMQLGMVGLGRMGGNMTERCMRSGHETGRIRPQPADGGGVCGEGRRRRHVSGRPGQ